MTASLAGIVAHDAGAELDYLISGGIGHLVTAVRNAIFSALEQELAPLELTASQFIVVIGAMRGRARTVNEFCLRTIPRRISPRRGGPAAGVSAASTGQSSAV
jgi:hypothetical protein